MAQQNATSPSLLELLDSSIWMNALRLVISANTMGTNAFLLLLFARHAKLRKRLCNQLILLNAIMDFVSGNFSFTSNPNIKKLVKNEKKIELTKNLN
jgi:hypothetical protein